MTEPKYNSGFNAESVSDLVVSRIALDGIDTVFGLTGGGIMYLIDSLSRNSDVEFLPMHHEEFAGVAADGYARAGKPYGVAFATTGPGSTHLFTAIAAAWQDSSPVLFVVGQVKRSDSSQIQNLRIRQFGTFEFDTTLSFSSITKSVAVIRSAEDAESILEQAIIDCQSGRPGPVVIEIPLDVQGAKLPESALRTPLTRRVRSSRSSERPNAEHIETILTRFKKASRPLFLMGAGVVRSGTGGELSEVLDEKEIPYIVTQFARGAGSPEHSLYLGSPGIKANRSANLAISECDLLIAIGTSLHQQVSGWSADAFRALPSYKIWYELDPDVISARKSLVDLTFNKSCEIALDEIRIVLSDLNSEVRQGWADWQRRCRYLKEIGLLHYPIHEESTSRMCIYRAVSTMSKYSGIFSASVTDAGIVWYVFAQHYFPAKGSHYLSSGSFGAMGMALPMGIGAARATRGKVLVLTGDGSIMTCLSEMATLSISKLPIALVINSNEGYLSIKTTHDRYFEGRRIGTDGTNGVFIPSIESLAVVFNLPFRKAHSEDQLEDALDEFAHCEWQGPLVIELMTYVDQVVEPLVESRRADDGSFQSASLAHMSPSWEDNYVW